MEFDHDNLKLRSLILGLLDGNLSDEQQAELKAILQSSTEAQKYYTEFIMLCAAIKQYVSSPVMNELTDQEQDESLLELVASENQAETIVFRQSLWLAGKEALARLKVSKAVLRRVAYLAAAAAVYMFALNGYNAYMAAPVATITDIMDLRNYSAVNELKTGSSISRTDGKIAFDRGFLELEFKNARVVLQGPCEFACNDSDELEMFKGSAYIAMNKGQRGFVVETPVSKIVDLGTEFGVLINKDLSSDVYVVEGKTRVTLKNSTNKLGYTLVAGSARRFSSGGLVKDIFYEDNLFARKIDSSMNLVFYGPLTLSLIDLTAGGDGCMAYLEEKWINPDSGVTDKAFGPEARKLDFRPMLENDFVDGTFVPRRDFVTRQIVSTDGDVFVDCPETCGDFYMNIGINPSVNSVRIPGYRAGEIEFDGINYNTGNNPSLVMHTNLGITYDLRAISKRYPDQSIRRFQTSVGIADLKENHSCNADIWVLVDGKTRFFIKGLSTKGVLTEIDVELGDNDRFLSLVTTDGGDEDIIMPYGRAHTCDWCVFTDPILVLE